MNLQTVFIRIGDSLYYYLLAQELSSTRSVLDVGCGSNSPLAKIPKHFLSTGVDAFAPSIEKSRNRHIHDHYIQCDVTKLDKRLKHKSFDAVIALDLIEHLTKDQGEQLLQSMERIAKKLVIVMTPNGFYAQEPYENNRYQVHKSGWRTADFLRRGYSVYGIRGLKFLRGEYATIRWKPWIFWAAISSLSQYLLLWFPEQSHQLFAIKHVQ